MNVLASAGGHLANSILEWHRASAPSPSCTPQWPLHSFRIPNATQYGRQVQSAMTLVSIVIAHLAPTSSKGVDATRRVSRAEAVQSFFHTQQALTSKCPVTDAVHSCYLLFLSFHRRLPTCSPPSSSPSSPPPSPSRRPLTPATRQGTCVRRDTASAPARTAGNGSVQTPWRASTAVRTAPCAVDNG